MSEEAIPKSWEWYGDAIKWFIAISAALLTFGFDRVKDGVTLGWIWWTFLSGATALGISAVLGLFAYLQLLGAANLLELPRPTSHQMAKYDRCRKRLGSAYQGCVLALMAGLLASSVASVACVWPSSEGSAKFAVTLVPYGQDVDPVILRSNDHGVEVLAGYGEGHYAWRRVQVPVER